MEKGTEGSTSKLGLTQHPARKDSHTWVWEEVYKGCRRLYEAGVQGKGARVLPAGAGQGSVWGSPAGARQTPIPEHCGHSALPYPEHLRGHGFLEVQDRDRFRHEEDDRRAARRGQARACVLELSLATCWSRTTASQAGTGDLEFQGASSPVSAVELGLIPVAPSSRSCQRPKSERPLIREKWSSVKVWAGAAGDGAQEENAAFTPRARTEGASSPPGRPHRFNASFRSVLWN